MSQARNHREACTKQQSSLLGIFSDLEDGVDSFEKSVDCQRTILRYSPEGSALHILS
jgi:hypothetical protein